MKTLSVVCARVGSKGLKNKCISKISAKKVAEYAIDYSLSLGKNVRTVVSTDIDELIKYCKEKGITCIKRDPDICKDESKIDDALYDAIKKVGSDCKYCSLVYGNIPTRYKKLFKQAVSFLEKNNDFDGVISMQNVEKYHPDWMMELRNDVLPQSKTTNYRRQMLPQKMIHDGHTLLFRTQGFVNRYEKRERYDSEYLYSIFGSKIKPLINEEVIIDIDTAKDLRLAEAVIEKKV